MLNKIITVRKRNSNFKHSILVICILVISKLLFTIVKEKA